MSLRDRTLRLEWIAWLMRQRRDGESLLDASRCLMIHEGRSDTARRGAMYRLRSRYCPTVQPVREYDVVECVG